MNILYVVPYVPNRIRVRPFQLIKVLGQLGHRVTVFTLWIDESEREDVEALRNYCAHVIAFRMPRWRSFWNCLRALPGKAPLQAVSFCFALSSAANLSFTSACFARVMGNQISMGRDKMKKMRGTGPKNRRMPERVWALCSTLGT